MTLQLAVGRDGILRVQGGGDVRASGTADVSSMYDEGGLFGTCKQDPTIVNAMVGPVGFSRRLMWRGVDWTTPVYQALTYIGTTGTAQASDCADCGKPTERRCAQSACFGRMCQQTNEVVIDDIGLRANQNVPRLSLFGSVTDAMGNVVLAQGQEIKDIFLLGVAEAGYNLALDVGTVLWSGNPTNNLGGRQEFRGFDLLINTGYYDIETMDVCELLDSFLLDYESNVVGASGSPALMPYVRRVLRQIRFRATRAGFPAESLKTWIVMHPNVADAFFDAYACEYGLVCDQDGVAPQRNDSLALRDMRDQAAADGRVRIDGIEYDVELDSQISQTLSPYGNETKFCSDIYFITTQVGGRVVTWGEYQDFNVTAGSTIAWFRQQFGSAPAITDGGRFLAAPTTSGGFCMDARVLTKPRIISLMPQLSGRVQNVCSAPLGGAYPDVTGSDGVYDLGGGAQYWPANYLYGDCWPTHSGDPAGPNFPA